MRFRLTTSVLLGLISAAFGQESPSEPAVLPAFRVNAARDKEALQLVTQRISNVVGGAAVVDLGQYQLGRSSNFADFFQDATGIYLSSDNSGEATKLSIRGSGIQSDETLGVQVLLDGLPYNQGDGEANLEELDLHSVSSAEVYRGANALRYGAYVLGGAINLMPRTGHTNPGVDTWLEAGSFGFRQAGVTYGCSNKDSDIFVSAGARQTDGFREHGSEHVANLTANTGIQIADEIENRVFFAFSDWERYVPGDLTQEQIFAAPGQATDEAIEGNFRLKTRSFRVADKLSVIRPNDSTDVGLLFHHRKFLIYDLYTDTFRRGVTDARSNNTGLLVSHSNRFVLDQVDHELVFGLSPAREIEVSQNFRNDDGVADRSHETAAGLSRSVNFPLFIEDTVTVGKNVKLVSAAQLVWIERKFEDRFGSDFAGDQSRRQIFTALNPKFGGLYNIGSGVVFTNVSRSFQPPSFDDLTPFQSGVNGSTIYVPLKAQHAWTAEIGSRGSRGSFEWDVALYHSWLQDELLELNDATGRDLGTTNVPRSIHRGLEMGADWEVWRGEQNSTHRDHLTFRTDYVWNDFRFEGDPVYGENRIAGIPVHLAKLQLMYQWGPGFYISPNLEWSLTSYFADHSNTIKVQPYYVFGGTIGYQSERVQVFLEMRNLQDRRYVGLTKPIADATEVSSGELGIFAPGEPRSLYVGCTLHL